MSSAPPPGPSTTHFPYFQYTSLLGTHTLLLAFAAVFLPAGTVLVTSLPPQQSSVDKPQHRLLEPITANPVWTLLWLCAGTSACQAWWAGWMRHLWATCPPGAGAEVAAPRVGEGKIKALRNAWTNTIFASALFHIIIVLFGAPISSHIGHTYLLSLLLSLLTIFVPSYTLSLPIASLSITTRDETALQCIRLFIQRQLHTAVERALVFPVIGSFVGCWVGAFPIPLDWDRPWQAWPLTPAYGALAGHLIGSWSSLLISTVVFFAGQDLPQGTAPETAHKTARKRNKKKRE
ncbi:GPI biosynthesis protein family Pig-F-domain-containing protein [Gautieria morchelliformis]|nr:GPI biosynthesis protein family Pig-F-domain-containing protein [Gautieria morchelliformis]